MKPPDRLQSAFDVVAESKRPQARRAISFETRSETTAALPDVGAQPPRIQDLVPPPTSPVAIARGLGAGTTTNFTTHVSDDPQSHSHGEPGPQHIVPDFALGRGGDGIGGHNHPSSDHSRSSSQSQDKHRKQKDTLDKLKAILAW
jgi:hypothetical protein